MTAGVVGSEQFAKQIAHEEDLGEYERAALELNSNSNSSTGGHGQSSSNANPNGGGGGALPLERLRACVLALYDGGIFPKDEFARRAQAARSKKELPKESEWYIR